MADGKTEKTAGLHRMVSAPAGEWKEHHGTAYRCQVYLVPRADGRYSVVAATLAGVAGEGATEPEALENIKGALAAAISAHKVEGGKIPWLTSPQPPGPEALIRWVIVHV